MRIIKVACGFFLVSLAIGQAFSQKHDDHDAHVSDTLHEVHEDTAHTAQTSDHTPAGEDEFNPSEMILHHILDTHDWHITDIPTGKGSYAPVALHLPWLFYSSKDGLVFAGNTHALEEKGYLAHHDNLYALKSGAHPPVVEGHDAHGVDEHWLHENQDTAVKIVDLSITKTAFQMILVGLLLLLLFTAVARAFKKNEGGAPKGIQSLFEPLIVFIRDEVAKPHLGKDADRLLPYLLTLFFFIWFSNLFGLMPFNSNIAGNISFTAAVAVLTFLITQFNGTKDYWKHIFNPPGVPVALKFAIPLVPFVEFVGLFTKPFALAVRLFANISAGHFMVLGLISLIFIMGKSGASIAGGFGIMPITILFTLVIFGLEMIVAVIQAYVFTLLTAVFVGLALERHDEHHHDEAAHDHH